MVRLWVLLWMKWGRRCRVWAEKYNNVTYVLKGCTGCCVVNNLGKQGSKQGAWLWCCYSSPHGNALMVPLTRLVQWEAVKMVKFCIFQLLSQQIIITDWIQGVRWRQESKLFGLAKKSLTASGEDGGKCRRSISGEEGLGGVDRFSVGHKLAWWLTKSTGWTLGNFTLKWTHTSHA